MTKLTDDKELEKEIVALAIKAIMVGNVGGEIILHNLPELASKVRALLQPKIEEATKKEMERIVKKIGAYANEFCSPSERKLIRYLVDTILKDK